MSSRVDASAFTAMCKDLSRISGKTLRHIIDDQAAQLLGVCIKRTHAASAASIQRAVKFKNSRLEEKGGAKLSLGIKKGNDWFLEPSTWGKSRWQNGNKATKRTNASGSRTPPKMFGRNSAHLMNGDKRWSNARWARYRSMLAQLKSRRLNPSAAAKSRGLAKASWLQIAEDIGVTTKVKAPDFVVNATTFLGRRPRKVGSSRRIVSRHGVAVELINRSQTLTGGFNGVTRKKGKVVADLNGHAILQGSINTRASDFARQVRNGWLNDIENRAKRYPGIFTR